MIRCEWWGFEIVVFIPVAGASVMSVFVLGRLLVLRIYWGCSLLRAGELGF